MINTFLARLQRVPYEIVLMKAAHQRRYIHLARLGHILEEHTDDLARDQ